MTARASGSSRISKRDSCRARRRSDSMAWAESPIHERRSMGRERRALVRDADTLLRPVRTDHPEPFLAGRVRRHAAGFLRTCVRGALPELSYETGWLIVQGGAAFPNYGGLEALGLLTPAF